MQTVLVIEDDAAGDQAGEATHVIEARAVEVLYEREDRVYVRGAIDAGERVVVDVPTVRRRLQSLDSVDLA